MTSVPKPSFGPTGFIAPSESDILAGVTADFNAAFGGNLNPDPTTPQGQLAVSWAAVIGFCNDVFLQYTNNVDPSYADGRMQDALARLYFLERDAAEPTTVVAQCQGLPGVVIPIGALAKSADGNTYSCTNGGTIPPSGVLELPFACITPGPIPCAPASLNVIFRTIAGWDSVTNPAAGVIGRDTESRAEFEARRAASVALNAVGMLPAIRASVLNVNNVLDAYVTENPTNAPVTIRGVTVAANSLYVSVSGGAAADVAKAIWRKKAPGCSYTGTTTETVLDSNSGYALPYPAYAVKFTYAQSLPVQFRVQIANSPLVPADAQTQIRAAIINAFAGGDGGARARIGSTLYAARYYAPVGLLGPWAQVVEIQIGSPNDPGAVVTASIAADVMTVTATASGAIAVGQTVTGPSVLPGTVVLTDLGSGTWRVSKSQTIASETITLTLPNNNEVIAHIDQVPTIVSDDITVELL